MNFIKNISLFLLLIITVSCKKDTDLIIPLIVKNGFKSQYPREQIISWEIDKNDNFEARFKVGKNKYRADFSPLGKWIETERNLSIEDLPDKVKARIKKDFNELRINEIEEVFHHEKGLFYDVEFLINNAPVDVEINPEGIRIN